MQVSELRSLIRAEKARAEKKLRRLTRALGPVMSDYTALVQQQRALKLRLTSAEKKVVKVGKILVCADLRKTA